MLVAGPFWGLIADKFHCHRLILIINCIGIILTMGCQPLLSMRYGDPQTNKCPGPVNQNLPVSNALLLKVASV